MSFRLLLCQRTAGISTTDLIGRILNEDQHSHIQLLSQEPYDNESIELYAKYSTDKDAFTPLNTVYRYQDGIKLLIEGPSPKAGQSVAYVHGIWDLFTITHVNLLRAVKMTYDYTIVGIRNDWVNEYPALWS